MQVTRKSIITGIVRTKEIDITPEVLQRYEEGIETIQSLAPHLSENDREFIMTGMTEEEWNEAVGPDEDDMYLY
jgi:hypothetical protein